MNFKNTITAITRLPVLVSVLALTLVGCSDDEDETLIGNFQFYNASTNAPAVGMKISLNEKENTHGPVSTGSATSYFKTTPGTYGIELIYQEGVDTQKSIYEEELVLDANFIQLVVVTEDIFNPVTEVYNIPVDDPETAEDIFNVSILNVHDNSEDISVYYSNYDQNFEQAQLFGQYTYGELSDSQEFAVGNYKYYITLTGSEEVLYESSPIVFGFTSQYILAVRENTTIGKSPYIIDFITTIGTTGSYQNILADEADLTSKYRIYNGLTLSEYIPEYNESFDLHARLIADEEDETPEISALASHAFSDTIAVSPGDYVVNIKNTGTDISLVSNNQLELQPYTNRTSFIYLAEEEIESDDDAEEESFEGVVRSLVVNNSTRNNVIDHQVNVINLVDDFSLLSIYFVREGETTSSALFKMNSEYLNPQSINLLNYTYNIIAVSQVNGNRTIISSLHDVVLDKDSKEKFLIIEQKDPNVEVYTMSLHDQQSAE